MSIKEGDPILLYLTERKRWLVKVIKKDCAHPLEHINIINKKCFMKMCSLINLKPANVKNLDILNQDNSEWYQRFTSYLKNYNMIYRKNFISRGFIELNNALDKEYGEGIKSSLGTTFWLLKPTMEDYVMKSARKTQIVYPKDMGIIAAKSGIDSGSIVIESGTGSGVLTGFIANLVKPSVKICGVHDIIKKKIKYK